MRRALNATAPPRVGEDGTGGEAAEATASAASPPPPAVHKSSPAKDPPGFLACTTRRDETFAEDSGSPPPLVVHKSAWALQDCCELCGEGFSLLRRRHHCRICGKSACGPCSRAKLPVRSERDARAKAQRACTACAAAAAEAPAGTGGAELELALSAPPPLQEAEDALAPPLSLAARASAAKPAAPKRVSLHGAAQEVVARNAFSGAHERARSGAPAGGPSSAKLSLIKNDMLEGRGHWARAACGVLYYSVGCLFYGLHSGLSVGDSVYFITVSCTTVGYGDLYPTTSLSMVFSIFYLSLGLMLVGALISQAGAALMERAEAMLLMKLDSDPDDEEEPPDWWQIVIAMGALLLVLLLGVIFFAFAEGAGLPGGWCERATDTPGSCWDDPWPKALYFCVATMTTVGYGDLAPQHAHSRWCCVLFILLSTVMFANTLDQVAQVHAERRAEEKKAAFLAIDLDIQTILEMDESGDGKVDKGEFLVFGLQMMGVIEEGDADVRRIVEAFDR